MAHISGRSWVLLPSRTRLCQGNWDWQSSSSCIAQVLTSPTTEKRCDNRRNNRGIPANYLRPSLHANTLQSGSKHLLQWPDFLLVELPAAVGMAWTLLGLNYLVTLYLFQKHLLCGEFVHRFSYCGRFINRKTFGGSRLLLPPLLHCIFSTPISKPAPNLVLNVMELQVFLVTVMHPKFSGIHCVIEWLLLRQVSVYTPLCVLCYTHYY